MTDRDPRTDPNVSRIQSTRHLRRGFKPRSALGAQAVSRAASVDVYDSVEAAFQAGLPMPADSPLWTPR